MDKNNITNQIAGIQSRLYGLLEKTPGKAITEARKLSPTELLDKTVIDGLKACVLVDAGKANNDTESIKEGIQIFRGILQEYPEQSDVRYNLANGLFGLSEIQESSDDNWHLSTWEMRREARWLYELTAKNSKDSKLVTQALTNIGNLLWRSYRWVEAYDSYTKALEYDSSNGIAAARAAQLLLYYADIGIGDPEILRSIAARHILIFKDSPESIIKYGGRQALESFSELFELKPSKIKNQDIKALNPYERFVAKNGLALSATIEGFDKSVSQWDSLIIGTISEPDVKRPGVPPVFGMFNTMKADYLLARWLAYYAFESKLPETGFYSDTLDNAHYGMDSSLITVAQKSCFDILDKITVATGEYLGIKGPVKATNVTNQWRIRKRNTRQMEWQPEIADEIKNGNPSVIALAELSDDFGKKGYLKIKKSLRNAATHRFIVLHKSEIGNGRKNKYIVHYTMDAIYDELISTLKTVRSALFYFVELIAIHEMLLKKKGSAALPVDVPMYSAQNPT